MKVKVKKLHDFAVIPTYATDGSGCFDISMKENEGAVIYNEASVKIHTGLAFEIPEGHVMLVFSRSGHGFKYGLRLSNCVGVIDSDYRGELVLSLFKDRDGDAAYRSVFNGRIAQALIVPIPRVEFEDVMELSSTARGTGGFGSTGQ